MTYGFVVEGEPIAQERPRLGKYGNFYDPSSKAKKVLGQLLLQQRQIALKSVLRGQIRLKVAFCYTGAKKRDVDNFLKAFMDSANGILWEDDSQVFYVEAYKVPSESPRTHVEITEEG